MEKLALEDVIKTRSVNAQIIGPFISQISVSARVQRINGRSPKIQPSVWIHQHVVPEKNREEFNEELQSLIEKYGVTFKAMSLVPYSGNNDNDRTRNGGSNHSFISSLADAIKDTEIWTEAEAQIKEASNTTDGTVVL